MRGFCFALRYLFHCRLCAIYVMPPDATNSSDYAGSRTALPTPVWTWTAKTCPSILFHFRSLIRSFSDLGI
jgi:hypothetical protein